MIVSKVRPEKVRIWAENVSFARTLKVLYESYTAFIIRLSNNILN